MESFSPAQGAKAELQYFEALYNSIGKRHFENRKFFQNWLLDLVSRGLLAHKRTGGSPLALSLTEHGARVFSYAKEHARKQQEKAEQKAKYSPQKASEEVSAYDAFPLRLRSLSEAEYLYREENEITKMFESPRVLDLFRAMDRRRPWSSELTSDEVSVDILIQDALDSKRWPNQAAIEEAIHWFANHGFIYRTDKVSLTLLGSMFADTFH